MNEAMLRALPDWTAQYPLSWTRGQAHSKPHSDRTISQAPGRAVSAYKRFDQQAQISSCQPISWLLLLRRSENPRDGAIVAFPTEGTLLNAQVLVLNQNYEPLNICNAKRALVMVFTGKAEILELDGLVLHTIDQDFRAPSVIRLATLIKRPRPQVKLTRREVFIRDHYTCQYCGRQTRDLTIDHVVPKSRHGAHTWENLVSACKECNHRKGGKTVQEARMRLLHEPYCPRAGAYYTIQRKLSHELREEWLKFIPGFEPLSSPGSALVYGGND